MRDKQSLGKIVHTQAAYRLSHCQVTKIKRLVTIRSRNLSHAVHDNQKDVEASSAMKPDVRSQR